MACDLGFEYNFAPAVLGSARMDRQGLPVSHFGRREDSELLAKLAAQLRVDPRGNFSSEQRTFFSASFCHICSQLFSLHATDRWNYRCRFRTSLLGT